MGAPRHFRFNLALALEDTAVTGDHGSPDFWRRFEAAGASVDALTAEFVHFGETDGELRGDERAVLEWLLS